MPLCWSVGWSVGWLVGLWKIIYHCKLRTLGAYWPIQPCILFDLIQINKQLIWLLHLSNLFVL